MSNNLDAKTPEGRTAMLQKVQRRIQELERRKEKINLQIIELSLFEVVVNELDGRQSKREFTITL